MKDPKRIASLASDDFILALVASLGRLPGTVRYFDDFDAQVRSIENFDAEGVIEIFLAGSIANLDFSRLGINYADLAKHLFFHLITEDLRASTAYGYIAALQHVDEELMVKVLQAGPLTIKDVWPHLFAKQLDLAAFMATKWMLGLLSQRHLCGWSPLYFDFISTSLPVPTTDKYATVRNGDAFLSLNEEAKIVAYLEWNVTDALLRPNVTDDVRLRDGGMLMFAYLFAMRPYQIAQVTMRDVRIWTDPASKAPSVHVIFKMIKQRRQSSAFAMSRRVRHDWAPLIALLHATATAEGLAGSDRFFAVKSANEVSRAVQMLASEIVGRNVTTTDLRHTGAQRLVDAGASQEELASFLGHSDITSGLVYFQSSPSQAERVNQALAISPIYQQIVTIAHTRFISPETLAQLKDEQQVAGVPHGIPISGIGGCATGQPACPYNPVTSCYGCRKFMPVVDIALHERVLKDLRGVVRLFVESSRNDGDSPAFQQLRQTLIAVQNVIEQLETNNGSA